MKFDFFQLSSIPKLAWACRLSRAIDVVKVYCGPWVEIGESDFIEGAWNLPFTEKEFDKTAVFFGSGGKALTDKVVLATPTHTLERLFGIRQEQSLYISNSLSFVLSLSENELDLSYMDYQADYDSITLGLEKSVKLSPLKNGKQLMFFCYCNIEVDKELNLTAIPKSSVHDFSDFNDYKGFLLNTIQQVKDNAVSKDRYRQYSLLATASRGYDSSCIAALAYEAGCRDVLTLKNARPKDQLFGKYKYNRQNSEDVAQKLAEIIGYKNVILRDRWNYFDLDAGNLIAESAASGNLYYDPTINCEDDLRQRVMLTGHFGDVVWTRSKAKVSTDFKTGGLSGASLYETRLRAGFIHVPLAYAGATSMPSINKITFSSEMSPYTLNNGYDRPIPRRILEEKGVPRELFGQTKKATGVILIGSKSNILSKMPEKSAQSFLKFYKEHKNCRSIFRKLYYCFMTGLYFILGRRVFCKFLWKIRMTKQARVLQPYLQHKFFKYIRGTQVASFLLPWGVSIVRRRYHEV